MSSRRRVKKQVKTHRVWRGSAGKASATLLLAAGGTVYADLWLLPLTLLLLTLAGVGFWIALRKRATVMIGQDGVRWTSDGTTRFVPYTRVAGTAVEQRKAHRRLPARLEYRLQLANCGGDEAVFTLAGPGWKLRRIAADVDRALTRYGELAELDTAPVARGSQTSQEWFDELRAIGAGARAGYRSACTRRDELWRIVETSTVPSSQRAAAAVALGQLDRGEIKRLRRTRRQSASPNLRFVLANLASGAPDEEVLAEALAELDGSALTNHTVGSQPSTGGAV